MKHRAARRDILAGIAAAVVSGVVFASPALEVVHGLSIDTLTAVRAKLFGDRRDPIPAPVVVVAIDEESYRTPPFKSSPTLTWTREIGRVLTAIVDGGAKEAGDGGLAHRRVRRSGDGPAIPIATAVQQPRGLDRSHFDDAEDDFGGHGDARLVVVPGAYGQTEPTRHFGPAAFAEQLQPQLAKSFGQFALNTDLIRSILAASHEMPFPKWMIRITP